MDLIVNFFSGHGTFEENGKIFSSLVGTVEKTNRY